VQIENDEEGVPLWFRTLQPPKPVNGADGFAPERKGAFVTQTVAVISGVVELALSFLMGLGVPYASFRFLAYLTREMDEVRELRKNNVAVGILFSSMLLSTALVARQAIYPIISTLQTKLFSGLTPGEAMLLLALSLGYVAFALVMAALAIAVGANLFLRLTRDIDEMGEIGRNNVAVALTLGAVIIVLGLFLSNGVQSLLAALIPEPTQTSLRIFGGPP